MYLIFLAALGLIKMPGLVDVSGEQSYVISLLRPNRAYASPGTLQLVLRAMQIFLSLLPRVSSDFIEFMIFKFSRVVSYQISSSCVMCSLLAYKLAS